MITRESTKQDLLPTRRRVTQRQRTGTEGALGRTLDALQRLLRTLVHSAH